MGDRGRLGRRQHIRRIVPGNLCRLRRRRRRPAGRRARIGRGGERVGQLINEGQLAVPDADHIARFQRPVAVNRLVSHHRTVAAVEIAKVHCPLDRKISA